MCRECWTYRELTPRVSAQILGLADGRYIISETDAYQMLNAVMDGVVGDEGAWYEQKKALWASGFMVHDGTLLEGAELPDGFWETYESLLVRGFRVYRLPEEAL